MIRSAPLIVQSASVVLVKGTPKRFWAIETIRSRGRPSPSLLVPIQARTPGYAWIRSKGDGGFWTAVFGGWLHVEFEQPYLSLTFSITWNLAGVTSYWKENFFSYSVQATTTDTQLLFFQQIMFHSNTRKVLGWDASATDISCVLRYLNLSYRFSVTSCINVAKQQLLAFIKVDIEGPSFIFRTASINFFSCFTLTLIVLGTKWVTSISTMAINVV